MASVQQLKDSILNNAAITGALLDSYVAGYYANKDELGNLAILNDKDNLRVGTVIDHQFAYGFVVHGELNYDPFTKCLRQKLNRMETDITAIIQDKANTMDVSVVIIYYA